MKNVSRIYLSGSSGHRSFYWVEIAEDKSVYIGSSNNKLFTYGYGGTATSYPQMLPIIPERDGRRLSSYEIANKTSIHGSGIVNLPTESNGLRDRVYIAPPKIGFEALPLIAVMPMEPSCYPVSQKKIQPFDLCLPERLQDDLPIGILLYLCSKEAKVPMPISGAKRCLPIVEEFSCELAGLSLNALVYSDPERLPKRPREEIQVFAHPANPGDEPDWAFFA